MWLRPKFQALFIVAFLSLLVTGCGPEKAKALRTAAIQFKTEALAAINAIDDLMRLELQPPPRTESAANEEFVKNILELDSTTTITSEVLELAIDPYTITPDPELTQRRKDFKNNLNQQYSTFASIFDELEKGNILARDAVKKSAPYAEKLTLQMGAFAKSIADRPPKLVQQRSAIITELDSVRSDSSLSIHEKRVRLIELKEQWNGIIAQEIELQEVTVKKCLKATLIGMEVRRLIDTYDKLSLDDLNSTIAFVLDQAGDINGKDFSQLKRKSEELFSTLEDDPIWSDVAQTVLNRVNTVVSEANEDETNGQNH